MRGKHGKITPTKSLFDHGDDVLNDFILHTGVSMCTMDDEVGALYGDGGFKAREAPSTAQLLRTHHDPIRTPSLFATGRDRCKLRVQGTRMSPAPTPLISPAEIDRQFARGWRPHLHAFIHIYRRRCA
jgi:hypothetical protein